MTLVEGDTCLENGLIANEWGTEEEIAGLDDPSKKSLLIKSLEFFYDDKVHSTMDLNLRTITGDKGRVFHYRIF